jgi:hypothetical protein
LRICSLVAKGLNGLGGNVNNRLHELRAIFAGLLMGTQEPDETKRI